MEAGVLAPILITAIAMLITAILLLIAFFPKDSLPGPKGISGFLEILQALSTRKPHILFMRYARKAQIFSMQILNSQTIFIYEKEAAKQLLTSKQFIKSNRFENITDGLLNNALFVLGTGEKHTRHRKLIQPGFGPSHLRQAVGITLKTCQKLIKIWNDKLNLDPVLTTDIHAVLATMALDVIGMVAFGKDLAFTDQLKTKDLVKWEALEILTSGGLVWRIMIPKMFWGILGIGSLGQAYKNASQEVQDLLNGNPCHKSLGLAKERQESIRQESNPKQDNWGMDVLERLLRGGVDGKLDNDEINGELLGFFLAGHETSANTLAFAILQLCYNPDIADRLYEEIKDVDLNQEDNPTEKLKSLKRLGNIMKEVQRLHSIIGSIPRVAAEDVIVMDRPFPKGTNFFVFIRGLHLNPMYYDNPEDFIPDRWDQPQTPGAWMPFGDGIHNCIGQKLAELEIKIILMELVRNFKFKLSPRAKVEFFTTITHGLKDGLMVEIVKR